MSKRERFSPALLVNPLMVFIVLCSGFLQNPPVQAATHVSYGKSELSFTPDERVARAREWVTAKVTYSRDTQPQYRFQNYRADCSGLVTMAWGIPATLPNYGLFTGTNPDNPDQSDSLSSVADPLGKALDDTGKPIMSTMNKLQKGDILLNQVSLDAQHDYAHVILFVGWIDIVKKQVVNQPVASPDGKYYYDGIEENGGAGKAIEHSPDHSFFSNPFDYSQPWPFPYYPGYYSEGYYAWRFDPVKAVKLGYTGGGTPTTTTIKPSGKWMPPSPQDGAIVTNNALRLAATAFPTQKGDPAIAIVYFMIGVNGSWKIVCPPNKLSKNGNIFTCDVNLKQLGIPYGQIQVSFDVYDQAGNVNLAPNGVHTFTYSPPLSQLNVYVNSQDGNIYALNASNGKQRWKYSTGSQSTSPLQVVDGVVYFIIDEDINTNPNATSTMYLLNAQDGTLIHHYKLPYFTLETGAFIPPFTVFNGTIFFSSPGMAFAINSSNGAQLWQYSWFGRGASDPVVVNNVVYYVTGAGVIYAFKNTDGTLLWRFDLGPGAVPGGSIMGTYPKPAIINNILYVVGWLTDNVYALSLNTHTLRWHIHLNNQQTDALHASNGIVYVGMSTYPAQGSTLYALQADNGVQHWSMNNFDLLLIDKDTLYGFGVDTNGSYTNDLYALHASDSTTVWHIQEGGSGIRKVAVALNIVFVMTDTALYALHANDGSQVWQNPILGNMVGP
ncbi:MAG: PQQ-binding-like beta-propeller repeat protein [Ktedonobacteraceae bacterium]